MAGPITQLTVSSIGSRPLASYNSWYSLTANTAKNVTPPKDNNGNFPTHAILSSPGNTFYVQDGSGTISAVPSGDLDGNGPLINPPLVELNAGNASGIICLFSAAAIMVQVSWYWGLGRNVGS